MDKNSVIKSQNRLNIYNNLSSFYQIYIDVPFMSTVQFMHLDMSMYYKIFIGNNFHSQIIGKLTELCSILATIKSVSCPDYQLTVFLFKSSYGFKCRFNSIIKYLMIYDFIFMYPSYESL